MVERTPTPPTILWFGPDLRLTDHPALDRAVRIGAPILPVYVWSPEEEGEWRLGRASRWWLARSLEGLDQDLRARGSGLIIVRGPTVPALERLRRETGAARIVWSRRDAPWAVALEKRLEAHFARENVQTETFEATRLSESALRTRSGAPFRKFTPFYRKFMAEAVLRRPLNAPRRIPSIGHSLGSQTRRWLEAIEPHSLGSEWGPDPWRPGSATARARLRDFIENDLARYPDQHDRMDNASGTSRLSPHLSFGEISAAEVWQASAEAGHPIGSRAFVRQLVWREFAYDQLIEFPNITDRPLRSEFEALETSLDEDAFRAWQQGRTGYPLVDAGMRQLAATGWMHNRVRMVAASFLIKHLALPWQWGAHWFWDHLVDADLAQNSLNWQWVAGSAVDASPYYRIFNPTRQGERFDPEGDYVRRWVPELGAVAGSRIHDPPESGEPGPSPYPRPVVDHRSARQSALGRYAAVRERRKGA